VAFVAGPDANKTITVGPYANLILPASIGTVVNATGSIINKGVVTTAATSAEALASIFSQMKNEGNVVMSGVSATLPITADFEIPAKIELTLTSDVELAGAFKATVNGILHVNGADLEPENLFVNGTLDLNTGTVDADVLTISSSAIIKGTGTITSAAVTINGKEGYSMTGTVGNNYNSALEAITVTAAELPKCKTFDTGPTAGNFFANSNENAASIIGSVNLDSVATGRVVTRVDMGGSDYISVTPGTTIVSGSGLGVWFVATNNTSAGYGGSSFALAVDTNNFLTVGAVLGSTTEAFGVVSFNNCQFVNSGLTGPAVATRFNVGVKYKY
jgi:hypothetical protein